MNQKQNGFGVGEEGDPAYTLTAVGGASVAVAFDEYNFSISDTHHTLRAGTPQSTGVVQPVVFEPGAMSRIEGHDPAEIAPTLRAHMGDNQLALYYEEELPATFLTQAGQETPTAENNSETGCLTPWPEMPQPYRVYGTETVTRTVDNNRHNILTTIPIDIRNATRPPDGEQGMGIGDNGDPSTTITTGRVPGVFAEGEESFSVYENQRSEVREQTVFNALTLGGGKPGQGYPTIRTRSVVRRLTPVECERLQGFPDDHTLLRADGKEQANVHRYKQMGNAVAVPVVEWVIAGIVEVHG
jgi:site-specific DNA-cytosine methylase